MSTCRQTACRHHWLIETPNGPTSRGRCKRCRRRRTFQNASGDKWIVPPKADVRLIARVKREEAVLSVTIQRFGQDGYMPFGAYRRNRQRVGKL